MNLSEKELKHIIGGISVWAVAGITAAVVFTAGAIDGWARPLKCRE